MLFLSLTKLLAELTFLDNLMHSSRTHVKDRDIFFMSTVLVQFLLVPLLSVLSSQFGLFVSYQSYMFVLWFTTTMLGLMLIAYPTVLFFVPVLALIVFFSLLPFVSVFTATVTGCFLFLGVSAIVFYKESLPMIRLEFLEKYNKIAQKIKQKLAVVFVAIYIVLSLLSLPVVISKFLSLPIILTAAFSMSHVLFNSTRKSLNLPINSIMYFMMFWVELWAIWSGNFFYMCYSTGWFTHPLVYQYVSMRIMNFSSLASLANGPWQVLWWRITGSCSRIVSYLRHLFIAPARQDSIQQESKESIPWDWSNMLPLPFLTFSPAKKRTSTEDVDLNSIQRLLLRFQENRLQSSYFRKPAVLIDCYDFSEASIPESYLLDWDTVGARLGIKKGDLRDAQETIRRMKNRLKTDAQTILGDGADRFLSDISEGHNMPKKDEESKNRLVEDERYIGLLSNLHSIQSIFSKIINGELTFANTSKEFQCHVLSAYMQGLLAATENPEHIELVKSDINVHANIINSSCGVGQLGSFERSVEGFYKIADKAPPVGVSAAIQTAYSDHRRCFLKENYIVGFQGDLTEEGGTVFKYYRAENRGGRLRYLTEWSDIHNQAAMCKYFGAGLGLREDNEYDRVMNDDLGQKVLVPTLKKHCIEGPTAFEAYQKEHPVKDSIMPMVVHQLCRYDHGELHDYMTKILGDMSIVLEEYDYDLRSLFVNDEERKSLNESNSITRWMDLFDVSRSAPGVSQKARMNALKLILAYEGVIQPKTDFRQTFAIIGEACMSLFWAVYVWYCDTFRLPIVAFKAWVTPLIQSCSAYFYRSTSDLLSEWYDIAREVVKTVWEELVAPALQFIRALVDTMYQGVAGFCHVMMRLPAMLRSNKKFARSSAISPNNNDALGSATARSQAETPSDTSVETSRVAHQL